MKTLSPAERLIVAADFKPTTSDAKNSVRDLVLTLADTLQGTGVYIKVNSALRVCGYGLIDALHARGLRVFADLKLYDIGETLSTDGALLLEAMPELLTVVCAAGVTAMRALKSSLPDTEVLGVTVLTSVTEDEAREMFAYATMVQNVCMFADKAKEAGIDGIICAPTEAIWVRGHMSDGMTINTPAIRPAWTIVAGDDQNPDRIMTPAKAIKAGADRIIVGRPIVRASSPYDAVMRTIEEISSAVA
jgi:orotidine-5'-phosphate decarboxylase